MLYPSVSGKLPGRLFPVAGIPADKEKKPGAAILLDKIF
jgi:hypothetical protein